MTTTRYKPLFSLSVEYDTTPESLATEGIQVEPATISYTHMQNLRLKAKTAGNTCTIYFEGTEDPVINPVSSIPTLTIETDTCFYFTVSLRDKNRINEFKFHSDEAAAAAAGFPLLYDAAVTAAGNPPTLTLTAREDVRVMNPVFTFIADLPQSGIAGEYGSLEIRDEDNNLLDLGIAPVKRNDKESDGPGAVPEFAFSVDASSLQAGVYELKAGNFKKNYFFATPMNLSDAVLIVRVLKNELLEYKTSLADNSFAQFELLIPKA
jgi:hypothetical protein